VLYLSIINQSIELKWLMRSIKRRIVRDNASLIYRLNISWLGCTYITAKLRITRGLSPENIRLTLETKWLTQVVNELHKRTDRSKEPEFDLWMKQFMVMFYLLAAKIWITTTPFPKNRKVNTKNIHTKVERIFIFIFILIK